MVAVQVAASATMSPTMVASLQKLLRTGKDIPIITPYVPHIANAAAERAASGGAAGTSGAPPAWGWGSDSGFWAGRAGATGNRGSAGGIATGGGVADSMPPGLQHCYIVEPKRHHIDTLRRLVHALGAKHVMVFMNHQGRLRDAMFKLAHRRLAVGVLHGEMPKQQRAAILGGFRSGKYQIILVSDVVARGLDVEECDAVVHLELPTNAAHYAHRAGRSGRFGRRGTVVSIIEKRDEFVVQKLSKALGVAMPMCKVAGGRATVIDSGSVRVLGGPQEALADAPETAGAQAGESVASAGAAAARKAGMPATESKSAAEARGSALHVGAGSEGPAPPACGGSSIRPALCCGLQGVEGLCSEARGLVAFAGGSGALAFR
jgi:Helicase conserved C-terminal domain